MSFLKEFQYTNISARRALYGNIFLTAAAISYMLAELAIALKYYFFYMPVFKTVLTSAMAVFLLGTIAGRLIFYKARWHRPLYVATEIVFILLVSIFLLRGRIWTERPEILMSIFEMSPYLLFISLSIPFFISGIKTNYLLKTSCGDFIDDRQATHLFYIFLLAGITAGITLKFLALQAFVPDWAFILLPALILPLIYYYDLPYSPLTQFAREYESEKSENEEPAPLSRESLIMHYMQFSIPVIYLYCMYIGILATQGNNFYNKLLFFLFIILTSLCGFIAGKVLNLRRWSLYAQISYPPLFFIPIMALIHLGGELNIFAVLFIFTPLLFVISFVFSQAIQTILIHYRQDQRFGIMQLSMFIMPALMAIILSIVPFTNFWFFFIIYFITMVNIILPGVFIINKKTALAAKGVYFGYTLIFISMVIFSHFIVPVALNNNFFLTHARNFDALKNINYNSPYIKVEAGIEVDGRLIFSVKDSTIRNLKRALAPISLYYGEGDTSKILFIDGNQKFFRNPGIGYFKRSTCLDPLSDKIVDFETLPFSGRQTYVPDSTDPLVFFRKKSEKFQIITDIPNILDQRYNDFRFSDEYYTLMKENLTEDGIFAQVINIPGCSADILASMAANLKKCFSRHCVYLFSDVMIILASDSGPAMEINADRYNNLTRFIVSQNQDQALFFDEQHALSHLLFTDISALVQYVPRKAPDEACCLNNAKEAYAPASQMIETYMAQNNNFLGLFDKQGTSAAARNAAAVRYEYNKDILSYLKATEFYESRNNYEKETEYLFNLKNRMDYHIALKEYMVRVLEYKEISYFETARKMVEEKQWERAKRLYQSILGINKDNFEANYQLGILSMTVQDIDGAAEYLQNAMRLKSSDPRVFYQMGVLEFTKGNIPRAIDYFTQALNQKETGSSLYLYLGMSYEEMGNIAEAENYYMKAQIADPNDKNIQTHLDTIRQKKTDDLKKYQVQEPRNQLEDEQDVDIPIPVNKSAYDIRLNDEGQELNKNKTSQP